MHFLIFLSNFFFTIDKNTSCIGIMRLLDLILFRASCYRLTWVHFLHLKVNVNDLGVKNFLQWKAFEIGRKLRIDLLDWLWSWLGRESTSMSAAKRFWYKKDKSYVWAFESNNFCRSGTALLYLRKLQRTENLYNIHITTYSTEDHYCNQRTLLYNYKFEETNSTLKALINQVTTLSLIN